MKPGWKIFLTIAYSALWFTLLFVVVGFFMIKPVAFYNKISGMGYNKPSPKVDYSYSNNNVSSDCDSNNETIEDEEVKPTSKYGYSDDPIEDETMFIDDMDED